MQYEYQYATKQVCNTIYTERKIVAKISKNLTRHKSENNFVGLSK